MKRLSDLSISQKWILTASIIGFFSTIIILGLLTGLKNSRKDFQDFKTNYYEVEQLIKDNTIDILTTAKDIRDLYIQIEKQSSTSLGENIKNSIIKIQNNTEVLVSLLETKSMPGEEYKNNINNWLSVGNKIIKEIELKNIEEAERLIINDCTPAIEKVLNTAESLTLIINESVVNSINSNIKNNNYISIFSLIMFLMAFIVSLILSRKMRKSMLIPIEEIRNIAESMKKGEYNISLEYQSKDELGILAESMRGMLFNTKNILQETSSVLDSIAQGDLTNKPKTQYIGFFELIENSIWKIITQMSNIIKQIRLSAKDVSHGAEEIAREAAELAQKVIEQEEIIDTFIECINKVSDNIQQNIDTVNKTSSIALHTRQKAIQGTEMMNKMLVSMDQISQSSKNISDITRIIDNIAQQTNLLALNASIEAARAGESGRGFAVVAEEIRDLANKSSETVKEIEKIIEQSILSVKHGEEMVGGTSKVLTEVMDCIEETTLVSKQLEENTCMQRELLENLTENTKQLKETVHGNIEISQESVAISQELAAQSDILRQQIETFIVD